MRRQFLALVVLVVVGVVLLAQAWAARVGDPAPQFTATDSHGKIHHLSDYAGKFVVLEWTNRECPYTRKHYDSGNMQRLQREWTQRGVVWLTVVSSAPGKQGYVTAEEENTHLTQVKASPTAVLLDPSGDLGHLYDAKTTPHMFVVSPQGVLLYNGAIDDRATADKADVQGARNYLSQALEEAMSGKAVRDAATRPYGCSVKYAH